MNSILIIVLNGFAREIEGSIQIEVSTEFNASTLHILLERGRNSSMGVKNGLAIQMVKISLESKSALA